MGGPQGRGIFTVKCRTFYWHWCPWWWYRASCDGGGGADGGKVVGYVELGLSFSRVLPRVVLLQVAFLWVILFWVARVLGSLSLWCQ